ncbi:diguanylate cyclase [Shinella sp. SUS2]|uniref:endonuclease/exonuclease/phosphatase family protein n=1 Tax=unclassified Shinella TaxID=2643062 RepID=UPI00056CB326|nr:MULTISPECIES: endonuclease/exonuclease/phosphatase family protein [unclassified Shinella]KNY19023.1 diguanylate cyclase [Shinella sp. SUS2]KOC76379.1 diguanylate cyclase [Shinella sp. GWS1]MDG4671899.1 endonuclease/exonuclease/phosphatase family protein [Shinella sp. 838]TAA57573.1 endonuclease/exonuclease/phosphatase family protein [Shinella sp. JR1-6]
MMSTALLSAIRNRRGHRPPENNRPGDTVIASYNVHKCVGVDRRFDPERTASVIAEIDADIIAIQEADKRFGERSGLLNLDVLERDCGLLPVPITALSSTGHGWHGNMILIRKGAVGGVRQLKLPGVEPRGALVVTLDLPVGKLRLVAAHFGLLKRSREQQAMAILASVAEEEEMPTLLVGDLNEWRIGRRSSLSRLQPTFDPASGAVPSFPSRFPVLALDRALGHPHDLVTSVEVHDTPLARVASDHLPIKAHIDLKVVWERSFDPTDRVSQAM